ncbi:uncharacterized protein At2g29880-like [Aristolochia californica]|uniref:uncharacterized protein At2g29880-like n=1 Tax=Aristolochia californica TaxID=171875 RepID=UPI0035E3AC08
MAVRRQPTVRSYDIWTFEKDSKMLDLFVEQVNIRNKLPNGVWKHERDAEGYRREGCPLYDKLALVVGISIAMGTTSIISLDVGDELLRESDPVLMDELEDVDVVRETPSPFISGNESTSEQSRRNNPSSSSRHRKRSELSIEDTSKFIDVVNRITQALNDVMKAKEGDVERDWVKARREIPDLSDNMKYCAPKWLDTPSKKVMFMEMTVEERVEWLKYCARKYL